MNDYISIACEILKKKYGAEIKTGYYSDVRRWLCWWRGVDPDFHFYTQIDANGRRNRRKIYGLNMAKRICEDWAAILLNEKTHIQSDDERAIAFLQGDNETGGVFGAIGFWHRANELIEKAFATGTGAIVLRVNGASVSASGKIVPDSETKISAEFLDAAQIIPLTVDGGEITEAAFVSERQRLGKKYLYIEEHTKGSNGNYIIRNSFYAVDDGGITPSLLPDGVAPEIDTGSSIPWFAIVKPNLSNNIADNNGLGISVYANALDVLRGVDLAYNNTNRDIYLGGKKVFYNKSMVQRTPDGAAIAPDDVVQQLFQQIGDADDFDAKLMVQEFNPSLRAQENRDSVQAQLDYLSFLCGLGTHRYQFGGTSQTVKTATEYVGNKQELVQMAAKHYIIIERAILGICRAILYIGRVFCGADVDESTPISVAFEDGYIIDDDSRRERDRQDVRDGLMSRWEYRVKWYGETEEAAKAWEQGAAIDLFGGV